MDRELVDARIVIHKNSKEKSVKFITESSITESENKIYVDKTSKKRMAFVTIFKVIFRIALIF